MGILPGSNNFSRGYAINDAGVVVGESDNNTPRAFLWQNGLMMDLNNLIPANSGRVLLSAEGINEHGDIVGFGRINGETHAFLLQPVPEPATGVLLGLGLLALLGIATRRRARTGIDSSANVHR